VWVSRRLAVSVNPVRRRHRPVRMLRSYRS
jgi:hypothetical protein